MEDVQDLVEMPDHLEERGQDEGAGQPGEGAGQPRAVRSQPLLNLLCLILQEGARHRTRASAPPPPATWPRPSSEQPKRSSHSHRRVRLTFEGSEAVEDVLLELRQTSFPAGAELVHAFALG